MNFTVQQEFHYVSLISAHVVSFTLRFLMRVRLHVQYVQRVRLHVEYASSCAVCAESASSCAVCAESASSCAVWAESVVRIDASVMGCWWGKSG